MLWSVNTTPSLPVCAPTMPHSVSPPGQDDEVMPDAPAAAENDTGVKLEDMFNDDEDEEFPASSAPDTKMESPPSEE